MPHEAHDNLFPRSASGFAVLIALGLGIALTTGVVCGRMSQRWGPRPDMVSAANHLQSMPAEIGSWKMVDESKLPEVVVETLVCTGYVLRSYVNQESGATVRLTLFVGPAGPTSVHTPEICMSSQDYRAEGSRKRIEITDASNIAHSFWLSTFRANDAIGEQLRVLYGWLRDRQWVASDSPRLEFAGSPMLYKLQLETLASPGVSVDQREPCQEFVKALLESGWQVLPEAGMARIEDGR